MIVETRTYTFKPGSRGQAVAAFPKVLAACKAVGMVVAGPWLSAESETVLVWMRGFPDAKARGTMTSAFYGSAAWQNELAAIFMPILEKYEVVPVEMDDAAVNWL